MTRARGRRPALPAAPIGGMAAWASGILVIGAAGAFVAALCAGGWTDRTAPLAASTFLLELAVSANIVAWSFLIVVAIALFAAMAAAEPSIGGPQSRWLNSSLQFGPAVPAVSLAAAAATALWLLPAGISWYHEHPLTATVLALSALNLPVMTARFRLVLRSVPRRWRVAAVAAGASPHTALLRVALPQAGPGIIAVGLNAIGQMLGETVVVVAVLAAVSGLKPVTASIWASLSRGGPAQPGIALQVLLLVALVLALRFGARIFYRNRVRAAR